VTNSFSQYSSVSIIGQQEVYEFDSVFLFMCQHLLCKKSWMDLVKFMVYH